MVIFHAKKKFSKQIICQKSKKSKEIILNKALPIIHFSTICGLNAQMFHHPRLSKFAKLVSKFAKSTGEAFFLLLVLRFFSNFAAYVVKRGKHSLCT